VNAPHPGRLIALEGIDGCGKSTQAALLADRTGALLTHEPGATPLGRELRSLLLDPGGLAPGVRAEALLMAADRAQHVDDVIGPALGAGRWVVTDRFSASTMAYQGWGRGLDVAALGEIASWAAGGLVPDLSVLVDVDPEVAARRLAEAADVRPDGADRLDRLERLDPAFHHRVRDGFLALARGAPGLWLVVDGDRDVDAVAGEIHRVVVARFGDGSLSGDGPGNGPGAGPGDAPVDAPGDREPGSGR
jgi:dTMP kinase